MNPVICNKLFEEKVIHEEIAINGSINFTETP